jgi:UDP-GlcNAc:undecaprenyl-phosphate GlcNAc-1-phosphate transferase
MGHFIWQIIGYAMGSALTCYVSLFFFRALALKFGVVDAPSEERKIHSESIALLGGAGFVVGLMVVLLVGKLMSGRVAILVSGALLMFAMNLVDDIRGLSARFRLFSEIAISLFVIFAADARISFLPSGLWGDTAEVVLTLVWFVGMLNAINYLDGMNGLAAGISMVSFSLFAFMLLYTREPSLGFLCVACAGVCLGFLPHNFPKARMFMGDAGSTFLGFLLAGIGATGNWASNDVVRLAAPVLILAVPIFDMTYTTVMRIKEDKIHNVVEWLQYASRDHFHHTLVDLGLSKTQAVMFIWLTSLAMGLGGVLVRGATAEQGIVTIAQAVLVFGMVGILIAVGKKRQSGWGK